jgi:N utilization substance protein B
MDRMPPVDRNILRAALAEFDLQEVPHKVIINEAIEIGKEYGSAETPRFLNGVLDGIWKAQRGEE